MPSKLFSPTTIQGLALPNRIAVSPMCQYSAHDGCANDWHLVHLGTLAMSGAGLLTAEATAVSPEGRITPSCLGLYSDDNEAALARVLKGVRAVSDVKVSLQLAHAGRKASTQPPWLGQGTLRSSDAGGWKPVAPSPVPLKPDDEAPTELDAAGLDKVRSDFAEATRRADRLGFDMLELHGGHGYLLSSFVSPLSNFRTDGYGGSLANRLRFPLEVIGAVRSAWPAGKPLGIKINGTDWAEGGSTPEEVVAYARALRDEGVDMITVSGGGVVDNQKVQVAPGYQLPVAEKVRREVDVTTCGVGMIYDPVQAEEIVASGKADMVAIARALLFNPRWPYHAALALGVDVPYPGQYQRASPQAWPPAREIAQSAAAQPD